MPIINATPEHANILLNLWTELMDYHHQMVQVHHPGNNHFHEMVENRIEWQNDYIPNENPPNKVF